MIKPAVLALYDATMRRDPPPFDGLTSQWVGPVLRTTGLYNLIEYADLTRENADAAIAGEVAHFKALGKPFEWKVFGHDPLKDLPARLEAQGLVGQDVETFLALDVAQPLSASARPPAAGIVVRRLTDPAELVDMETVIQAAFGRVIPEQAEATRFNFGKGGFEIFIAYEADGRPVGCGRLDTPKGKPFCGLYAGGVDPGSRGKGVYRAVLEARTKAAAERGYQYAIVEAGPMSLPILKRVGFTALTTSQPFEFTP